MWQLCQRIGFETLESKVNRWPALLFQMWLFFGWGWLAWVAQLFLPPLQWLTGGTFDWRRRRSWMRLATTWNCRVHSVATCSSYLGGATQARQRHTKHGAALEGPQSRARPHQPFTPTETQMKFVSEQWTCEGLLGCRNVHVWAFVCVLCLQLCISNLIPVPTHSLHFAKYFKIQLWWIIRPQLWFWHLLCIIKSNNNTDEFPPCPHFLKYNINLQL